MLFDLTGKTALITGSSRGIGRSIAEEMARLGAKVVISSRKEQACKAVAAEMTETGLQAVAIPCNVGHKDQLQILVDKTRAIYGQIDILVCNAAVNPVYGPMADVQDDAFDRVMNTNVRSTFWLCNMVLPEMAERRDGAVILLSSIAGLLGNAKIGVYGISKAAVGQMVRNLAQEWGGRNIRVNAIAPGLIQTDFARALWEDEGRRARVEAATPLGRIGVAQDVGGLAAFLATPAAGYITGQTLVVDGGLTISNAF